MDTTTLTAVGAAVLTLLGNQWMLHLQNRKDLRKREDEDMSRDNRLAFLLENFPPHTHADHTGINYPAGMDPRHRR